jgi:hypothetical protein
MFPAMEREVVHVLEPHLHARPIGLGMAVLRARGATALAGLLIVLAFARSRPVCH